MNAINIPSFRLGLLALLGVVGCAAPVDVSRISPESVLVGADVVVAGPPGYCVAPQTLRETETASFVVLGSCAALSGGVLQTSPVQSSVLTILVSPPGEGAALSSASEDQLATFFGSDAGKAALSPNGEAEGVEVLDTQTATGQVFVRAKDVSGERPSGVDPEYWRALLDVNGHLVTATLIGFEAEPVAPSVGLQTLSQLALRLLRENPTNLGE